MKYVSKENLEQYDSLIKQYIQDKANDVELLAYGVEWDSTSRNPVISRIGNPLLHKQLPIQSAMRGCICQGEKIMYYLNPDNWYLKEKDNKEFSGAASWIDRGDIPVGSEGETVKAKRFNLVLGFDGYTIDNEDFDKSLVPDPGQYIIIYKPENPNIYAVYVTYDTISYYGIGDLNFPESIEVFNNGLELGSQKTNVTIVFGANHSGYDGTVQVEIPEWYLWSEVDGTKRRVWCSLNKVVPYAQKIPHMLMDAHRNTILRTTTSGMGYLDTLPANSAICVTNYQPYCRGGKNESAYDSKLYAVPEQSDLGKPVTSISRAVNRTACVNANREPLCYEYYKAVFYWLYTIEYANRHCQDSYKAELTADGYRQGGLGMGSTTLDYYGMWAPWSRLCPISSCGVGNSLGNNTGLIRRPEQYGYARSTNIKLVNAQQIDGTYTKDTENNSITYTNISANKRMALFTYYPQHAYGEYKYTISGLQEGQEIYFRNNTIIFATATQDGEITVNWTGQDVRSIHANFSGACNITITNTVIPADIEFKFRVLPINIPRWRGFDDPFGNIWTNLDGIIIKQPSADSEFKEVYTTTNPEDFGDTAEHIKKMQLAGKQIRKDGYISDFDLGKTAQMIPSEVAGSSVECMCDYAYTGDNDTSLRLVLVGGNAYYGVKAGLSCFHSNDGVALSISNVGVRSLKVIN